MLYTRSSFIKWLTDVKDCEIININDRRGNVITIKMVQQQLLSG